MNMGALVDADSLGTFDYVIVGAGSAGCVLANRLSEDPSISVLLLEAGQKDDWRWIHIPAGTFYLFGHPRFDWCYSGAPEPMLDGRRLPLSKGKVLGGSSSINGMVYIRGHAEDYERWKRLGNSGWGWQDVLPYFKKSERQSRGSDRYHGGEGELSVEDLRTHWDIFDNMVQGAASLGIPQTSDFNRGDNEGCGVMQVTQHRGRRCSAAAAFLRPALSRSNLHVLTGATATRLRFNGKRAVGVEFIRDGVVQTVSTRREVLLSLGSIGSPQLLQLSGVGPAAMLQLRGIPVRHELPGVGANLQDHLSLRFSYRMRNVSTLNEQFHSLPRRALMGLQYLLRRSGPLVMGAPTLGGFTRSDAGRVKPNVQFLIAPMSMKMPEKILNRFPGVSGGIYNLNPESRGHVHVRSGDPLEAPEILHNYLKHEDDQRVAIDSVRLIRKLFASEALAHTVPEELLPGPDARSDDEIFSALKLSCGTAFHPVGTCKMGDDTMSVVDERLRVRGISGLRVVDASIMPTIPSGNTNAPTIMIAEKAADMIKMDSQILMECEEKNL
ncbi:GMC family oxidoreductase [Cupriavidus basilensis]|uniref:GMC family oxidoreductase n=1 Tax=Cupriavidus basilensis TaxID=68895 RepID=UPI0020C72063|nr:choline dehydrogenase [Cupriavidus basilensis]